MIALIFSGVIYLLGCVALAALAVAVLWWVLETLAVNLGCRRDTLAQRRLQQAEQQERRRALDL